MFNWLKKRFATQAKSNAKLTIDTPSRILWALNGLSQRQALIAVRCRHSLGRYDSRILEVHSASKIFTLAELNPVEGHSKVKIGSSLTLEAAANSTRMHFSATVTYIEHDAKQARYTLELPETIECIRGRISQRVHLPADHDLIVRLPDDSSRSASMQIDNLSAGGIGLRIKGSCELHNGSQMSDLRIQLPDGRSVTGNLDIRHTQTNARETQVGGRFVADNPADQQTLDNIVSWLNEGDDDYEQRREDPRLKLDTGEEINVRIGTGGREHHAQVEDISAGGLGLRIDVQLPLKAGDFLENIVLEIPGEEDIKGSLDIRYAEQDESHMRIGGRFRAHQSPDATTVGDITSLLSSPD